MFSSHFDHMVSSLTSAEEFRMFRRQDLTAIPEDVKREIMRRGHMARKAAAPGLREWLASAEGYDSARRAVRSSLADMLLCEAVTEEGRAAGEIADMLYSILAEPSWSVSDKRKVPMRKEQPDAFAAETAALMVWAKELYKNELETVAPGICEAAMDECRERLVDRLDDPAFCETVLRRPDALSFAAAAVTAVLYVPQDESLRWLRLKNLLRIAERCVSAGRLGEVYRRRGLAAWLTEALCMADIAFMCDFACSGESGLCADEELRGQAKLISSAYIGEDILIDEKTYMKPALCGADVYRLGAVFDDDAVCAIGEKLESLHPGMESACGITGRLLNVLWSGSFANDRLHDSYKHPRIVVDGENGIYAARPSGGKGFYAGMYLGALVVYLDGECILTAGEGAAERSIPWPERTGEVKHYASDISVRQDGFPTISMNLAGAYGPETCVSSWQRTVMVTSGAENIRLVDAFDFSGARRKAAVRFITPARPVVAVGAPRAVMGSCLIEWDGPASAEVALVSSEPGKELYALVLSAQGPAAGGCWTYFLRRST